MKIAEYLLESISELNNTLNFSDAGEKVLRNIMGSIMGLTFSRYLLLFRFDNRTKDMKILGTANFDKSCCKDVIFDLDADVEKKLLGKYFLSYEDMKSLGVDQNIFNIKIEKEPHIIPLFVGEELVGLLLAVSIRKVGFNDQDAEIFMMIQNNLATYIQKNYSLKMFKKEEFNYNKYPYPIAKTLHRGIYEMTEAKARHDVLFNTIETIIKYVSSITIALYKAKGEKCPQTEKTLKEFTKPSLGSWVNIMETIHQEYPSVVDGFFIERFFTVLFKQRKPDDLYDVYQNLSSMIERKGNIKKKSVRLIDFLKFCVVYRNERVHGPHKDEDEIKQSIDLLLRAITSILVRLEFVFAYPLLYVVEVKTESIREDGNRKRIYSHSFKECKGVTIQILQEQQSLEEDLENGTLYLSNFECDSFLQLYPMMIFRKCNKHNRDEIFFLDSSKAVKQADYISYQCGCKFRPKGYVEDIRHFFDLDHKKVEGDR